MSIKRIGILTAGGDCPGLNAVVRAVSKSALKHGIEVLGFKNLFMPTFSFWTSPSDR